MPPVKLIWQLGNIDHQEFYNNEVKANETFS